MEIGRWRLPPNANAIITRILGQHLFESYNQPPAAIHTMNPGIMTIIQLVIQLVYRRMVYLPIESAIHPSLFNAAARGANAVLRLPNGRPWVDCTNYF
jgi:hypothetical protein